MRRCSRFVIVALAITALWSTATGAEYRLVGTDELHFTWAPSSGDVITYLVYVQRDRGAWLAETFVRTNEARIPVTPGETVSIMVRAVGYDATGAVMIGPRSDPSAEVQIDAPPSLVAVDGEWTLFCPTCPSFQIRSLADGRVLDEIAMPASTWALAARVRLGPGQDRLVWQAPDGSLSLWDAATLRPLPAERALAPAGARIVGAVDFDGDGHSELVLHDAAGNRVELWSIASGALERVQWLTGVANATLAGAADFDDDGDADLVWLTPMGIRIWHLANAAPSGDAPYWVVTFDARVMNLDPAIAYEAGGLANYDGRGGIDLLLRTASGELWLASFYGTTLFDFAPLPPAPGDDRRRVAGSLDLDGDGDAEVVLQHRDSGALQALDPGSPAAPRSALLDPGATHRLVDVR